MNSEHMIQDLKKELRKRKRQNESLKTQIEMLQQEFRGPKHRDQQSGMEYLKKQLENQMRKSQQSQDIIFSMMQTIQKITHVLLQTMNFSELQELHSSSMESILKQLDSQRQEVSLKQLEQKASQSMDKLEMVVGDFRLKFQEMKRLTMSFQKMMQQLKTEAAQQIKNLKRELEQSVNQSQHLSELLQRSQSQRQTILQSFKKAAHLELSSLNEKTKQELVSLITLMAYRIRQIQQDKDQIIKKEQKQREKLMLKYKELLNEVKGMRNVSMRSITSNNF